jgi:hypothetical protein
VFPHGRFMTLRNLMDYVGPVGARRFSEMVQQTPALRDAQWEMVDRMAQIAAKGIAVRTGLDPGDPEPQIAVNAILGLWRVQFGSMAKRYGRSSLTRTA